MRSVAWIPLVGVALLLQCHQGPRPQTAGQAAARGDRSATIHFRQLVSCEALCDKTFNRCLKDVLLSTGMISRTRLETYEHLGYLRQVAVVGYQGCLRRCAQARGRGRNPEAINRCLRMRRCVDYVSCLRPLQR